MGVVELVTTAADELSWLMAAGVFMLMRMSVSCCGRRMRARSTTTMLRAASLNLEIDCWPRSRAHKDAPLICEPAQQCARRDGVRSPYATPGIDSAGSTCVEATTALSPVASLLCESSFQ